MKRILVFAVTLVTNISLFAQNWSGTTPGNIFYNQGNIGIGTTSPEANADITTKSSSMLLPNKTGSTNTAILRVGYFNHNWGGVQLDMGVYNYSTNPVNGYPAWIQARNPIDFTENRNLLLNPNGGNIGIGTITPKAIVDISTNNTIMKLPNKTGSENTALLRIGSSDYNWGGVQLDMGVYNYATTPTNAYPAWIQARSPINFSINRNLLLNPNGGKVGIGTDDPTELLTVAGTLYSREVKVEATAGADFVFEETYPIQSLDEVEAFVKQNKHLPEIAPAAEMEANGIKLGEMNIKLLQKVEELTLYLIEQNKTQKELIEEVRILKERNSELEREINKIKIKQ